jgi:hypothetical protein
MRRKIVFGIGFVIAGITFSTAQTPAYHALVLGVSDGRTTIQVESGVRLNRWGQVIGTYGGGLSGGTHAVLWTPNVANNGFAAGKLFSIESSPGLPSGAMDTWATGLNDRGQVTGGAYTPGQGDGNQTQSWMWRPTILNSGNGVLHGNQGTAVTFPLLNIPALGTLAEYNQVINNKGVIGAYGINYRALLWTPSTLNGMSGTWTYDPDHGSGPSAINDAGQIAGGTCQDTTWNGPYLHSGPLPLDTSDVITSSLWISRTFGECVGGAAGINSRGDLAISAISASNGFHAYLYKTASITDVSTGLSSQASAINNYDQVVGHVDADTRRAYLFEKGKALDLNTLTDSPNNPFLRQAVSINDAGQILVAGVYIGAAGATVLLTPKALVMNPVTFALGTVNHNGSTYTQTITLTNNGSTSMPGPISVALDALTPGVTLTNSKGQTFYTGPGSAYSNVSSSALKPGATTPSFTLVFSNPQGKTISYKPRALQSSAPR